MNSNIVQITGLASAVSVLLEGTSGSPEFRICSNASCSTVVTNWQSASASISNNQYLQVRMTSSSVAGTTHRVHVFVGSTSETWSITTSGTKPLGYLVLSAGTFGGSLGGRTNADATCLTQVQGNDWLGKSSAGTLDSSRVKAFLCDGTGGTDPLASVEYKFAVAADLTKGGASVTMDANALGPNNEVVWNSNDVFGMNTNYWTGRGVGTVSTWSSASGSSHCNNWSSGTGGQSAVNGNSGQPGSGRWAFGAASSCNSAYRLLCIVNPP